MQDKLDVAGLAVPLLAMIDIDHGDVSSPDPEDTDPYAWARTFAARSPLIHIKQSSSDKRGHRPFTEEYNCDGRIVPEKLIEAIRSGGGGDNELCMELAFREREPADREVVAVVKESVAFWKPFADIGRVLYEPRSLQAFVETLAASSIAGREAARTLVIPPFTAIATRRSGSIKRNV